MITEQELKGSIQYEDEALILFHKKSGTAVQTKQTGKQDLVSMLKNYRVQKGEDPYIAPINRLDQPVEGLVLFAKNAKAAADLSAQLTRGEIGKWYLAVVPDQNLPEEGHLRDFIKKDAGENLSRIVQEGMKGAKEALLDFRKIKTDGEHALVEIRLLTGRHHQIRAQMAFHGWPLLGDRKYGITAGQNEPTAPALCAYRLSLRHPVTGEKMEFERTPKGKGFSVFSV